MNIRSSNRVKGCGSYFAQERGAALIVALSVFLVLLSLAITFSIIVRFETQMTSGATSRAQAERLLDGAMAQAQYRLNRDLNLSPDAMSLDQGWRSWFNGAAFVGKEWTRAFQGEKSGRTLFRDSQGLICVNLEPVEQYLRDRGILDGSVLYALFREDGHIEPLFRGPRTESWLNVPRRMEDTILLFEDPQKFTLMNSQGNALSINTLNTALENNRPERFQFWTQLSNPGDYPFVVPDEGVVGYDKNGAILTALPQETVNMWADLDSTGDGMNDAIWMPIAREVNHYGDGIDNMLSGIVDPAIYGADGSFEPLFESAPFVYHGLGLPEAVRSEDLYEMRQMENVHWAGRLDDPPLGDGYDNDNNGGIDDPSENRLFLTVPLPNLVMQVDLNNDGIYDERDFYEFDDGSRVYRGPVYVQLPPVIYVKVVVGQDASGSPLYDRIPLHMDAVDTLDNDYDLIANNLRTYAYVGPHLRHPDHEEVYREYRIPYSRNTYGSWRPFQSLLPDMDGWYEDDKDRPVFAGAHNRAYHDINVDVALNGPEALRFFMMPVNEAGQKVELRNQNPLVQILRQSNALHITCSGEPVSEIIGRYAVHIDDESGKVDLNTAGAYVQHPFPRPVSASVDERLYRSLHLGRTTFEYDSRLLPDMGKKRIRQFWGYRTGSGAPNYDLPTNEYPFTDPHMPGYGVADDDGNALLLALTGWDEGGRGLPGMGLYLPKLTDYTSGQLRGADSDERDFFLDLADFEYGGFRNRTGTPQLPHIPWYDLIGNFDGINEPSEFQLYNPLKSDRLFLRKEELRRHGEIGTTRWEYLRNLVTTNSEKRNIFHKHAYDQSEAFHQLDPNTATPQQLAANLILKTEVGNAAAHVGNSPLEQTFSEGLRQFDTAFIGDIMGAERNTDPDRDRPNIFPADPLLQLMRLATDIAAARTPQLGVRRLSTDNVIRNRGIYRKYFDQVDVTTPVSDPFPGELNERERTPDTELFPTGDIQEFIESTVDANTNKRVISPDLWWKEQTGEERLIQYTAASLDAIRINEIMVRPVRRVEAEMSILRPGDLEYNINLDPRPYDEMLEFYLARYAPELTADQWQLRSAYDYGDPDTEKQPLLGDRTAWVYEPSLLPSDMDILEFRFQAREGLPAGRYYLTPNFTDQYGRMTVSDVDVLEYAIKYVPAGAPQGISGDMELLAALADQFALLGDNIASEAVLELIARSFQSLDEPDFFATEGMRREGSASPVGWAFLPNRGAAYNMSENQPFMNRMTDYLNETSGIVLETQGDWADFLHNICRPFFWVLMGGSLETTPDTWADLTLPVDDLDQAWFQLLGVLDSMYNSTDMDGYYAEVNNFTVFVPPTVDTGVELSVAVRMNHRVRDEYIAQVETWVNFFDPDNPVAPPQPATRGDYYHVTGRILDESLAFDPDLINEPLPLAINFFDFSQEPMHEYLELANVSDEEVDLSGWVLEVGIPDPPGATHDPIMKDPYKSRWKIPTNTKIAAHGYLLLGVDHSNSPLLNRSGIELFSSGDDPFNPTVPPIDNSNIFDPNAPADETGSVFHRPGGLPDYIDNDGDGVSSQYLWDINDYPAGEVLLALDTDHVVSEMKTHGVQGAQGIPAGSRITMLQNIQLWKENTSPLPGTPTKMESYLNKLNPYRPNAQIVAMDKLELVTPGNEEGLKYLARFLLRGGVFPNYPERDGIDNDGDGGYVASNPQQGYVPTDQYDDVNDELLMVAEDLLSYVPGTLDKDMVDNNLDNFMDNRGYELPWSDEPVSLRTGLPYDQHGNPLLSEGVDEGWLGFPVWYAHSGGSTVLSGHRGFLPDGYINNAFYGLPRFFGPGSYEAVPLSPFNLNHPAAREAYIAWENNPFDPVINPLPHLGFNMEAYSFDSGSFPVLHRGELAGRHIDSPDWQAFVERRWNPGDNVIITLYVGDPSQGIIADQVTYNELDVINRTKDDIAPSPYEIDGFTNYGLYADPDTDRRYIQWRGVDATTANEVVCLAPGDPARYSFWLPDHMGLDFYRSLERKHPLYHGDRFGLANRWTATDGAYDDWAESMSVFETGLGFMLTTETSPTLLANRPGRQAFMGDGGSGVTIGGGAPIRDVNPRFVNKFDVTHAEQLYGHAFWGSPLRMNTQARHWENPRDLLQVPEALANAVPDLAGYVGLKDWLDPAGPENENQSLPMRNQRFGRQFAGLDAYRNTGHKLELHNVPAQDGSRRLSTDWAVRRAKFPKKPFATLGDLLELPAFSFEKLVEGPDWFWDDGETTYFPQYAVSVLNTHYYSKESKQTADSRLLRFAENMDAFRYGVDRDLSSALLSQAVYGGGASIHAGTRFAKKHPTVVSDVMAVSAMNPKILTVGQAQTVPLWPGPGAVDPQSGNDMTHDNLRALFDWKDDLLPHMWTPVYFCNLPYLDDWGEPERPWQRIRFPRMIDAGGATYTPQILEAPGLDEIFQTVYLFNGLLIGMRLTSSLPNQVAHVTDYMTDSADNWPMRETASIVGGNAQTDRAAMYVSRAQPSVYGTRNRPEMVFVWDRETGLENGEYIAYVGTFIPGLREKLERAHAMLESMDPDMPSLLYDGPTRNWTKAILDLDPTHPDIRNFDPSDPNLVANAKPMRFAPRLAMEFITDRRTGSQMYMPGQRSDREPAMPHPYDWQTGPGQASGAVFEPDPHGYIFYSDHPSIAWRPIPVRVEDNYLALRVRNMGDENEIACITHVVLAPAPRTHGMINVNTTEMKHVVRGETGNNWTVELFSALFGLPGVINALNVEADLRRDPYLPDSDLGLPDTGWIPHGQLPDPWHERWKNSDEVEFLNSLGPLPPPVNENLNNTSLVRNDDADAQLIWQANREGRATLRLSSLISTNRPEHGDGRYYEDISELLRGSYTGGIAYRDGADGPWPLSNLGLTDSFALMANPDQISLRYGHQMEARHDEIVKRFSQMSNLVTTRSNVFEIIATVQVGSVIDSNDDGVMDYRGDEFYPEAEARGRVIYDLHNRTVFQDEYRARSMRR